MEDARIVDLYWARSEEAITRTAEKYGNYCFSIAYGILSDPEDAKEGVNDTYLAAWDSMPPHRPMVLSAFLGKITRRISIDKWRKRNAKKRSGLMEVALEELENCIPGKDDTEQAVQRMDLTETLDRFLASLSKEKRVIFMQRYWYLRSVREIAEDLHIGESKVKMVLLRTRNQLRSVLEEEGILL